MINYAKINRLNAALLALALGAGSALADDGVWVDSAAGGNWDATGKWVDESIPGVFLPGPAVRAAVKPDLYRNRQEQVSSPSAPDQCLVSIPSDPETK